MRKWKRQLAWLMAVSMLAGNSLTSYADVEAGIGVQLDQTSGDEASGTAAETGGSAGEAKDGEQSASESTVEIATPSETEKEETDSGDQTATESEPDTSMYEVTWEVYPEGTAEVSAKEEIRAGKTLKFKVKPEKGWEIESVFVNNEEVEPVEPFLGITFGTSKRYEIEDVHFDQQIEVNMKEEAEEEPVVLTAEDGGMSVTLSEIDEGALADVASIEAVRLENDADVEAAVQEQLGEKQLADYAALDIKLYDKDGNEVEPAGEVSVTFGGVETEAEYDSVEVYHLTESDAASAKKPARAPMKPNVMAADDEMENADEAEAASVYDAEKVTKGVEEKIADNGEITFTAKKFSPYVIIFVTESTNSRVEFVLRALPSASTNNKVQEIKNDEVLEALRAITVGTEKKVNIETLVQGYGVTELQATAHRDSSSETWEDYPVNQLPAFSYQYATFEDSENADKKTDIELNADGTVEGLGDADTIYLWYRAIEDLDIPVVIHFAENRVGGNTLLEIGGNDDANGQYEIGGGKFYDNNGNASELITNILQDERIKRAVNNYNGEKNQTDSEYINLDETAFAQAQLRNSDTQDWDVEIVSASKDGANAYARTKTGEVVAISDNSTFSLHLFFVKGYVLNVKAEEDISSAENTINDQPASEIEENQLKYVSVGNSYVKLSVKIATGYTLQVSDEKGTIDKFDSSELDTPLRTYEVSVPVKQEPNTIIFKFNKAEKVFDYQFIADHNDSGVNFHASKLSIQIGDTADEKTLLGSWDAPRNRYISLGNATSFVLKFETAPWKNMKFLMDSLSINGRPIEVPNLNNLMEDGSSASYDTVQNIYSNKNLDGDTDSISAKLEKIDASVSSNGTATYKLYFTDVNESLKITGGNFKNKAYNEIVYRSTTTGVGQVWTKRYEDIERGNSGNNSEDTKQMNVGDVRGFRENYESKTGYRFEFYPEEGYYISNVRILQSTGENLELSAWNVTSDNQYKNPDEFGARSVNIPKNDAATYRPIDVEASAIKYRIRYNKSNGEKPLSNEFSLTSDVAQRITTVDTLPANDKEHENQVFYGWKLREGGTEYQNGTEISRADFLNSNNSFETKVEEPGIVYINAYPVYRNELEQQSVEYTIKIVCDIHEKQVTSDVVKTGIIGSEITTALALEDLDVQNEIQKLQGYHQFNPQTSKPQVMTLNADPQKNIMELHYTEPPVKIIVGAQTDENMPQVAIESVNGDKQETGDGKAISFGLENYTREFKISVANNADMADYVPDKYIINGKEISYNFTSSEDNTYSFSYKIDLRDATDTEDGKAVDITITFAEKTYSVNYDDGVDSGTVGNMPQNVTGKKFKDTIEVSSTKPTREGYEFIGWLLTSPQGVTITNNQFMMPKSDVVLTAQWKANSYLLTYNGNGNETGDVPDAQLYTANAEVELHQYADADRLTKGKGENKLVWVGWTTEVAAKDAIVESAEQIPDQKVVMDSAKTVYALYAKDTNGNNKPDYEDYLLTYNGNGNETGDVPDAQLYTANAEVELHQYADADRLTKGKGENKLVWVGWTTEVAAKDAIVESAEQIPDQKVVMDSAKTVYALYAKDTNGNNKPDYQEDKYKLTYDKNGTDTEVKGTVPSGGEYYENNEVTAAGGEGLKHVDNANGKVVFAGWTKNEAVTKTLTKDDTEPENFVEAGENVTFGTADITLYAVWAEDTNDNGTPDYREDRYGVSYDANGADKGTVPVDEKQYLENETVKLKDQNTLEKTDAVFLGWSRTQSDVVTTKEEQDAAGILGTTVPMDKGGLKLYAVWAIDKNDDDKPDYIEYVSITFHSDHGFSNAEGTDVTYKNQVPGLTAEVPAPVDTDDDGVVFTGWTNGLAKDAATVTIPEQSTTYEAIYKEDKNNNGVPDEEEDHFTLTFNSNGGSEIKPLENVLTGTVIDLTKPEYLPARDHAVFMGWTLAQDVRDLVRTEGEFEQYEIITEVKLDGNKTVTAVWGVDHDNNGRPDWRDPDNDNGRDYGNGSGGGNVYTAGVDGNWVHMDPNDFNKPITEAVPDGATPVNSPNWHTWKFYLNNGTVLYDQWAYIKNPYAVEDQPREGWFSFEHSGIMEYGWYLDTKTSKWYYMHRESDGMLGTMETGWHKDDQDGKWYYLNPGSGEMLLGWQQIGGKWYYFNPFAPSVTWNFSAETGGWTFNGSTSRPYGSMYQNEMTPDGFFVDETGAWVEGFGAKRGWYYDGTVDKWFYVTLNADGTIAKKDEGWHKDEQDGRWYYLQPGTGEMLLGWQTIDGKQYYFNPAAPEQTWNYNETTKEWSYNGSTSRPYGSMYENETTPDGKLVGKDGAWIS